MIRSKHRRESSSFEPERKVCISAVTKKPSINKNNIRYHAVIVELIRVERHRKSLVRIFILTFFLQNIISLTGTNNRNVFERRIQTRRSADPLFIYSELKDFSKHTEFSEKAPRSNFKVSPTRIRFSTSSPLINSRSHEVTSKRPTRENRLDLAANFSHIESKWNKQMAPAYEIWPELGSMNYVKFDASKLVREMDETKSTQMDGRRLRSGNLSSRLRNLLPKPVPFKQSSTSNRIVRVRSISNNTAIAGENSSKLGSIGFVEKEPVDEINREANELSENSTANEVDSPTDMRNSDSESNLDPEQSLDEESENPNISFKVLDSKELYVRADANRASKSPVYPPGDLERLYSDALLVYVKDFNQYIKS